MALAPKVDHFRNGSRTSRRARVRSAFPQWPESRPRKQRGDRFGRGPFIRRRSVFKSDILTGPQRCEKSDADPVLSPDENFTIAFLRRQRRNIRGN
jgi:hypothetical protein